VGQTEPPGKPHGYRGASVARVANVSNLTPDSHAHAEHVAVRVGTRLAVVPSRMTTATVYVLPSVREPYPMSVLEVMSVGLAVAEHRSRTRSDDAERVNIESGHSATGELAGYPDPFSASDLAVQPDHMATIGPCGLVERLRRGYHSAVIAAAQVFPGLTASPVSDYADAVPLLVAGGRTKRRNVANAAESVTATGASLTNVVLVRAADPGDERYTQRRRSQVLVSRRQRNRRPLCLVHIPMMCGLLESLV
jgi:hypothetical protein